MSTNTAYKLNKKVQKVITDFISLRYVNFDIGSTRNRLENIDRAIQLENRTRRKEVPDYYDDTVIPLVDSPVTATTSFLIGLYLANPQVFEVVSKNKEYKDAVKQMNAVIFENANATGWAREYANFFRSITKYNIGAMLVEWEKEQAVEVTTNLEAGSNASASAATITSRQGNRATNLDMYNLFYDTSVDAAMVHRYGEFCGYIESISMVELARLIESYKLNDAGSDVVMNETHVWSKGSRSASQYYVPNVTPEKDKKEKSGMSAFFSNVNPTSQDGRKTFSNNHYEKITFFARIIPSMFGITEPGSNKLQIWKFVCIGWDTLLYAEKQNNAHNFLPTVLCQPIEDNIGEQVKSLAERVIPMQNLSTKFYDARIAGLARALSDRGIYMQGVIQKKDIDSNNPTAKIPMRPNVFVKSVKDAYFPIPYRDELGSTYLNEIGFLKRQADEATLVNRPQQGQFQKGNKTAQEYNDVMSNADANMQVMALHVESQAMGPIKTIIKTNMLQYQDVGQEIATADGDTTTVDTTALREAITQFKLADGLRTKESIIDPMVLDRLLQLLMTSPQLQQQYSLPELIDYVMGLDGVDLSQFKQEQPAMAPQPPAAGAPDGQPT